MNISSEQHESICQHTIKVQKDDDGMFTATVLGAKVAPFRAATEKAAIQGASNRADDALKDSTLAGL